MKTLSLSLLFVLASNSYAQETFSPDERFMDSKTKKLVRVCEVKNGELVVKQECGKHWDVLPRKREEIYKEVSSYKDLNKSDLALFQVKQKDGTVKTEFGEVSHLYENGLVQIMQTEAKKTGFSKGAQHWTFDSKHIIKLDKKNPLLSNANMCAKEDTKITYSYNEGHSYTVKKGEKVALKAIFENQTAVVSLDSSWDNFWGYGLNNQLTVDLAKLEVCESEKQSIAADDSSRANHKEPASVQEKAPVNVQKTETK